MVEDAEGKAEFPVDVGFGGHARDGGAHRGRRYPGTEHDQVGAGESVVG
jgi:hypothetical protein